MFYSIIKIINRLISKEMSKIYLNVTIKKNWPFQNFDLLSLKICFHVSFWRAPTHADIIQFQNFLLQPKNQSSESKTMCGFCFDIERNHGDFKSKKPCILLNENINFNENETKLKMENSIHSFREVNLVLQLMWESQIKSKTVMSKISLKKKESIFCTVYFVRRKFF